MRGSIPYSPDRDNMNKRNALTQEEEAQIIHMMGDDPEAKELEDFDLGTERVVAGPDMSLSNEKFLVWIKRVNL